MVEQGPCVDEIVPRSGIGIDRSAYRVLGRGPFVRLRHGAVRMKEWLSH